MALTPSVKHCGARALTRSRRINAVATTDDEFPSGGLPWAVDPRQPSLFAAAWTLGSAAALSGAGVDGLTYYDTVGPRGVIEIIPVQVP